MPSCQGLENPLIQWRHRAITQDTMADWVQLFSAPAITVSPTGLVQGQAPNNGANFGPDTRGTTTCGIQEALNAAAASGGGRVLCLVGVFNVSSPLIFAGPYTTLEFEPGCSLTFANGLAGTEPGSWYSGLAASTPAGLIWMGSDPTSGAAYSHQHFIGSGLQLNFGSNDPSGSPQSGILLMFAGQASSPAFSGGVSDISIEGVIGVGGISNFVRILQDNFGKTSVPYSTFPRFLLLKDVEFTAYTQENLNNTESSTLYIEGGIESRVEGCRIDCSLIPSSYGYDPLNLSAAAGEVFHWYFGHCYFKGNGSSGQCAEFQGSAVGTRASDGLHDCVLEQCTFDSGASSGAPGAGGGGIEIDDAAAVQPAEAFVYGLEFRQCLFVFTGCTMYFSSQTVSAGASPWTYTNSSRATQLLILSGGTISSITVNSEPTGQTTGQFLLRPGDTATVTYTAAPTASAVPVGRIRFVGTGQPGQLFIIAEAAGATSGRFPLYLSSTEYMFGGYVGVGSSTSVFTNSFGFPILAIIQGGTVSAVKLNLLQVASSTNVGIPMLPGDFISITYSTAPSLNVQPL